MKQYTIFVLLFVSITSAVADYDWSQWLKGSTTTGAPVPCGVGPIPVNVDLNDTATASLGQVVWQVSVQTKSGGKWAHSCGGVVIHKQAVLTSASCVDGLNAGMVRSEAGIVNLPKGGYVRRRRFTYPGAQTPGLAYTEAVKVHPKFNKKTLENNLAVLRLATAMDFAKAEGNISYICLPTGAADLLQPEPLFVSGWGSKVGPNPVLRPVLQLKNVQLVNCTVSANENEFCAAQISNLKQCEGDLGGPLYTGNTETGSTLVAIASRGSGCTTDDPLVYLDVFPHLEWILEAGKPYY